MGKKEDILSALRRERAAFEAALDGLTPEQLSRPGVTSEGWSVKDLLAHLAAWEAELVTAMFRAGQGGKPSLAKAIETMDAWNAERYQENAQRPLDRIMADWRGVRQALLARLEGWDERQVSAPVPWRKGRTMDEMIAANSYAHEAEHRVTIEEWRRREGI